jgi:GNAT superfamily N-acetyltransferase
MPSVRPSSSTRRRVRTSARRSGRRSSCSDTGTIQRSTASATAPLWRRPAGNLRVALGPLRPAARRGETEETLEEFRHRDMDTTQFDRELSLLARDGPLVAGYLFAWPDSEEDPSRGHVAALGTRRPYRGRGIAEAARAPAVRCVPTCPRRCLAWRYSCYQRCHQTGRIEENQDDPVPVSNYSPTNSIP